jgi:hypothetical protein
MNDAVALEKSRRVRVLNDNFRSTFKSGIAHVRELLDFDPGGPTHGNHR